mgnify:CR=1 FL=1
MSRTPVAGTRLARHTVLAQVVTGVAVAVVAGLLSGPKAALAAGIGAAAVVLGSVLMGQALLGGGVQSATGALGRLLLGMVGKWVLVAAVFVRAQQPEADEADALGVAQGRRVVLLVSTAVAMLVTRATGASKSRNASSATTAWCASLAAHSASASRSQPSWIARPSGGSDGAPPKASAPRSSRASANCSWPRVVCSPLWQACSHSARPPRPPTGCATSSSRCSAGSACPPRPSR